MPWGIPGYRWKTHGVPFFKKTGSWEIDIYAGDSPFSFAPAPGARNPVLTANDVTDIRAYFVADPFMIRENDTWFMFFEALNRQSQRGEIAFATSADGKRWKYQRVILAEPFHLSYPYVFKWHDQHYMVPESFEANAIRLYRAVEFPTRWAFVAALQAGEQYVDSSVFHAEGMWWLFTSFRTNDVLRLFNAEDLLGPWHEHPSSPVVRGDPRIARPGGRVLVFDGRVVRFAQDCLEEYGRRVRALEITKLTTSAYAEHIVSDDPISRPTRGAPRRIHHLDAHRIGERQWIACADSFRKGPVFGLRY
jgi:hypothetical protein